MITKIQEEDLIVEKRTVEVLDTTPLEINIKVLVNDEINDAERTLGVDAEIFYDYEEADAISDDAVAAYHQMPALNGMPHPFTVPMLMVNDYEFNGKVPEQAKGLMYIRAMRSALYDAFSLSEYVNIAMYVHKKDMPAIESFFKFENIADMLRTDRVFAGISKIELSDDWALIVLRTKQLHSDEDEEEDELLGESPMGLMS